MRLVNNRVDYERILSSNMLTPRDRQVCAMYLCNLDQAEMAQLLGITQQAMSKSVDKCLRHLMDALMGRGTPQPQRIPKTLQLVNADWDAWMIRVIHNQGKWWNVPDSVRRYIQQRFGLDGLASERDDYDDTRQGEAYPCYRVRFRYDVDITFPDWWRLVPLQEELDYNKEAEYSEV